jgi:hypothetical protein
MQISSSLQWGIPIYLGRRRKHETTIFQHFLHSGCIFVCRFCAVCVDCHKKVTPGIINDWQISKHFQNKISCSECHGDEHKSAQDVAKVKIPTPDTCAMCHEARVKQFKVGKHAAAWAAMKAMPLRIGNPWH